MRKGCQRIWSFVGIFVASAVIFWAPDILIHGLVAAVGKEFGLKSVVLVTLILPAVTLSVIPRLLRYFLGAFAFDGVIVALFGIWITGPIFMMISASFSGAGFSRPAGAESAIYLTFLFPFSTFSFATYDGALLALLLTTAALPFCEALSGRAKHAGAG